MSGGTMLLVLGAVVASPVGRMLDQKLTAHYLALNQRRDNQLMSWFDRVECRLLYTSIALGGRLFAPEAGQALWHYLHGQGKDLWLRPDYIKKTLVVRRSLALLHDGESRRFTFRQSEDIHLSYVINPFNIKRIGSKILLWQRIDFKTDPTTYTTLDYGAGSFRLPDALIHTLHPQPYTLYAQWEDDFNQ